MPYDDSQPREPGVSPVRDRPVAERPLPDKKWPNRADPDRGDAGRARNDARPQGDVAPEADASREGVNPKVDKGDGSQGAGKKRGSARTGIVLGGVAILALIGGSYYFISTRDLESTDDAFTDGRAVTIAPQVSGYVRALNVNDNQYVKAGQVLLTIGQRQYLAARDQAAGQLATAQGQLDNARAALRLAHITYPAKLLAAQAQLQAQQAVLTRAQEDARRQTSISRAATTQSSIDQALAGQRQGEANVAAAKADLLQAQPVDTLIAQSMAQVKQLEGQVQQAQGALDRANIDLDNTVITAPQDGWITKRNVELGNYLTVGASLASLVSPQVWITANFKESQLDRMRPGQAVNVTVDAYPSLKLKGHVDSVQLGSGSKFTAFPAENATGNYVKIVQRVPVKIAIDSGLDPAMPLPLGISVEPTVALK